MARSVLIVDDIAFVRKTLADLFAEARYHVAGEAADGQQAVMMYKKLQPDFVTMDIVMPKLGGIEATRQITNMHKEARVIVISAMGQENLVMEAIHVGAKDYIMKPFSAEELIKTVERVFSADEKAGSRAAARKAEA